jgi:hypothetical protein
MSDLFDAAAERNAIETGQPLSQTLAEIKGAPRGAPFAGRRPPLLR